MSVATGRSYNKEADDFRHVALGDVGSTNSECLELAKAGDPGRLWVTANRQLQGRGRRGRQWVSEAGNLYASLLLVNPAPVSAIASLPLVAAVAVHRAIERVLPSETSGALTIKWPNDILLDGAKCCGILLESEILADGRRAVVIGCGINVGHAPSPGLYPTVALNQAGAGTDPQVLFAHLFQTMAEELGHWSGGEGLNLTIAAWLARAQGVGQTITVRLADRALTGRFCGLDQGGRLLLKQDDAATVTISAGDVFFDAAASTSSHTAG